MAYRPDYQGIIYPDRAERLSDFQGYKVFLNHWDSLSSKLGELFEGVALRGEGRVLAVHGEQGKGKTLFANQINADFRKTKEAQHSESKFAYNENNLWHRVSGGTEHEPQLIRSATARAEFYAVEGFGAMG